MEGGIHLSSTGYIQVHAYAGNSQLPLKDVAVLIRYPGGKSIAARFTNRSGMLDAPIAIEVPDKAVSLTPGTGQVPFTGINIYARKADYEQIEAENIQIFADTVTMQNLEMIPLSELPNAWDKVELFDTPPQNL